MKNLTIILDSDPKVKVRKFKKGQMLQITGDSKKHNLEVGLGLKQK